MVSRVVCVCAVLLLCLAAVASASESWDEQVAYMQQHTVKMVGLNLADVGDFDTELGLHVGLRLRDKYEARFGWASLEGTVHSGWSSYSVDDDYWYVMGSRIWRIKKKGELDEYRRCYVGAGIGWHFADADLKLNATGQKAGCRKYSLAGHVLVGYDIAEDWTAELYWVFGSDIWDWDIDGMRLFVSWRFK